MGPGDRTGNIGTERIVSHTAGLEVPSPHQRGRSSGTTFTDSHLPDTHEAVKSLVVASFVWSKKPVRAHFCEHHKVRTKQPACHLFCSVDSIELNSTREKSSGQKGLSGNQKSGRDNTGRLRRSLRLLVEVLKASEWLVSAGKSGMANSMWIYHPYTGELMNGPGPGGRQNHPSSDHQQSQHHGTFFSSV